MSNNVDLKVMIPETLSQLKEFIEIFNIQGNELASLYTSIEDVLNQCFINTATWGVQLWERMLSIKVDESKDLIYRKQAINSKIRGFGTINIPLLETVVESFDNGKVEIIEHNEDYSFEIKFIDTKGVSANFNYLSAAINEIKPAHLAVIYTFTYNTHQSLNNFTHGQLAAYNHLKMREGEIG